MLHATSLAGADSPDFAVPLQEHRAEQAIMDAEFSAERARLAAEQFGATAPDEQQRIVDASGGCLWGTV